MNTLAMLVIDGGSTDGTQAVVETFRQAQTFDIRLLAAPVHGVAAQRNYGASVAQHDLLLFLEGFSNQYLIVRA